MIDAQFLIDLGLWVLGLIIGLAIVSLPTKEERKGKGNK